MVADGASEVAEIEVALLDSTGVIVAVNQAWHDFCLDNDGDLARTGVGMSYLAACAAVPDDEPAQRVAQAIRAALAGGLSAPIVVTIACDEPHQPRWFDVLVSSRADQTGHCIGATVTLSASKASRRPGSDQPPASAAVPFPDVVGQQLESTVAELVERVRGVLAAHARMQALLRAGRALIDEPTITGIDRQLTTIAREIFGADQAVVASGHPLPPSPAGARLAIDLGIQETATSTFVLSRPAGDFSDEERWLAQALATHVAAATGKALLLAEVQRRRRWQEGLTAVAAARRLEPSRELWSVAAPIVARAAAGDATYLGAASGATPVHVSVTLSYGPPTAAGSSGTSDLVARTVAEVVLSGRPRLAPDQADPARHVAPSSLIAAPLPSADGATSGAIAVVRTAGEPFEAADLEQLVGFLGYVELMAGQ